MIQILDELRRINSTLSPGSIEALSNELLNCKGRIVGLGAGRMGYSLQAFIMRLSHLGYASYMIGDTTVPRIGSKDIVIVNSSSGETQTIILLAKIAKNKGAKIIGITHGKQSSLSKIADVCIFYEKINSNQLMKTIYEQFTYLLFDNCAEVLSRKGALSIPDIEKNHSVLE